MFRTIVLTAVAGIVAWLLLRMFPRREKPGIRTSKGFASARSFAAVSVFPAPTSCQVAQALKGERFLSREAPHLPLAGCTAGKCHCVYHHHTDRRSGNGDRRTIGAARDFLLGQRSENRRLGAGRRQIDKESDLSWT